MKNNLLLTSILFMIFIFAPLKSMDNKRSCLTLLLTHDKSYSVEGYRREDGNDKIEESDRLGKSVFDMIQFNNKDDRGVLHTGLLQANFSKSTVNISYGPQNARFLATITPIVRKSPNGFVVVIRELNNQ